MELEQTYSNHLQGNFFSFPSRRLSVSKFVRVLLPVIKEISVYIYAYLLKCLKAK